MAANGQAFLVVENQARHIGLQAVVNLPQGGLDPVGRTLVGDQVELEFELAAETLFAFDAGRINEISRRIDLEAVL